MATIQPAVTRYINPLKRGKVRRGCSPYLHELALAVVAWNELHSYDPAPAVGAIEQFLAIVQKDEHACFFG